MLRDTCYFVEYMKYFNMSKKADLWVYVLETQCHNFIDNLSKRGVSVNIGDELLTKWKGALLS